MIQQPPDSSAPRSTTRVPMETQVNIEFEKFSGFVSEYSSNISNGGIYIKTKDPKPVGTVLSFEFKLRDNFRLIHGLGEVAWTRRQDEGELKPAGMGIRFHEIDNASRELIQTIVDQHVKRGGIPFDLQKYAPMDEMTSVPSAPSTLENDFHALFSEEQTTKGPSIEKTEPLAPLDEMPLESDRGPEELLLNDGGTHDPFESTPLRRFSFSKKRMLALGGLGLLLSTSGWFFFKAPTKLPAIQVVEIAPTAAPTAVPTASPTPSFAPLVEASPIAPSPTPFYTPLPKPPSAVSSLLSLKNIRVQDREKETLLILGTSKKMGAGRFSHVRVSGTPSKEVIKLKRTTSPSVPAQISLKSARISRIRVGYHPDENETHVVLDLASSRAYVSKMETKDLTLYVYLKGK